MFRSIRRNLQKIEATCALIAVLICTPSIILGLGARLNHRQAEVMSPVGKKTAVILKYGNIEICTDAQGWFTIPAGVPAEAVVEVLALDRRTLGTIRMPNAFSTDTTIRYVPVAPVGAGSGD